MHELRNARINNAMSILQGTSFFAISLVFCLFSGCSIWNADLDPDYQSTRAEQLCHPYGQCSQGAWVDVSGSAQDSAVAKTQCTEVIDQRYGNGWWKDSVSRGLEIGRCMENKGFRLQQ